MVNLLSGNDPAKDAFKVKYYNTMYDEVLQAYKHHTKKRGNKVTGKNRKNMSAITIILPEMEDT